MWQVIRDPCHLLRATRHLLLITCHSRLRLRPLGQDHLPDLGRVEVVHRAADEGLDAALALIALLTGPLPEGGPGDVFEQRFRLGFGRGSSLARRGLAGEWSW